MTSIKIQISNVDFIEYEMKRGLDNHMRYPYYIEEDTKIYPIQEDLLGSFDNERTLTQGIVVYQNEVMDLVFADSNCALSELKLVIFPQTIQGYIGFCFFPKRKYLAHDIYVKNKTIPY